MKYKHLNIEDPKDIEAFENKLKEEKVVSLVSPAELSTYRRYIVQLAMVDSDLIAYHYLVCQINQRQEWQLIKMPMADLSQTLIIGYKDGPNMMFNSMDEAIQAMNIDIENIVKTKQNSLV